MIGRTIEENQRQWDSLLPYIMAAYRSSTHESTRYSPNYLTFGREVRAPAYLVYGTPSESVPTTFGSYAEEIEIRMKQSYTLVREQLGVAAQRNKHTYDVRVRPARYKVGDWVLFFNPRKHRGKQDKWRRKYTGPYLVVGVPGPVNITLQSGPKAKTFFTHIDKIKTYTGNQTPRSWIPSASSSQTSPGDTGEVVTEGGESRPTGEAETIDPEDAEEFGSASPGQVVQWWPPLTAQRSP